MVGKGKEGERATSVPWRHWKAELNSHIVTSNIEPTVGCPNKAL
jgi:hypothetical protein